jgi:hypothetical protein
LWKTRISIAHVPAERQRNNRATEFGETEVRAQLPGAQSRAPRSFHCSLAAWERDELGCRYDGAAVLSDVKERGDCLKDFCADFNPDIAN